MRILFMAEALPDIMHPLLTAQITTHKRTSWDHRPQLNVS